MLDFNVVGLKQLSMLVLRGSNLDDREESVKACASILKNSSTEEFLYVDGTGVSLSEHDVEIVVTSLVEAGIMRVDKLFLKNVGAIAYRVILNTKYMCAKEAKSASSAFSCISSVAKPYCLKASKTEYIPI